MSCRRGGSVIGASWHPKERSRETKRRTGRAAPDTRGSKSPWPRVDLTTIKGVPSPMARSILREPNTTAMSLVLIPLMSNYANFGNIIPFSTHDGHRCGVEDYSKLHLAMSTPSLH
jgi:hypothetical protein